jgi:hypothetical protein
MMARASSSGIVSRIGRIFVVISVGDIQCPMLNAGDAQCSMPNAQCSMPNA